MPSIGVRIPVLTPSADVLNFLALLRQEPESDLGSSADEGVPGPGAGWVGRGEPMKVGTGYTSRPVCDGLSLASPGDVGLHMQGGTRRQNIGKRL